MRHLLALLKIIPGLPRTLIPALALGMALGMVLGMALLWPAAAQAEALLGRVLSIDRERGELAVEELAGGESEPSLLIPFSPEQFKDWSLERLRPGQVVRIWVESRESGGRILEAGRISSGSGSMGSGRDPTGVRSRLGGSRRSGGEGGQGGGGRR